MSKFIPTKPKGAQTRLCSLTYSQLAEWTGLAARSIQSYAARGDFDRNDLESVLRWVNGRRASAGLPMIGQPKDTSPEAIEARLEAAGVKIVRTADPVRIPIPSPASGGYNPQTGEYQ